MMTHKNVNKKLLFLIVFIILLGVSVFSWKSSQKKEHVHNHAGFKVFVDGQLQDLSDIKYMNLTPCGDVHDGDDQAEKAHLHDQVGTVVHMHRDGAKWKDLFQNIEYPIDASRFMRAFVNGTEVQDILDRDIKAYDSLMLFIGASENPESYHSQVVTRQEIEAVEAKSELCAEKE